MSAIREGDHVMDIGAFWDCFRSVGARRVGPTAASSQLSRPAPGFNAQQTYAGNNFDQSLNAGAVCAKRLVSR